MWCGVGFQADKAWNKTCSPACRKNRREVLKQKRTVCVVCGGLKNSRHSITCSPTCREKKKSESATGKSYNLCVYDAPDHHDYNNMLSILHRKGYVKADNCKEEKWTYSTLGFPRIQWVDRVARGVVVSWEASTGQEQQGYEDGVQSSTKEVGASAHAIKELRPRNQGGTT